VLLAKILWIGVSLAGGWKTGRGFWRFASTLIYLVAHDGKKKTTRKAQKSRHLSTDCGKSKVK